MPKTVRRSDSRIKPIVAHDTRTAERHPGGGLLIQSLLPGISPASRDLSVRRASIGRRIGVSQVPIPK